MQIISVMVFGAAFYSLMVAGDNKISHVFPLARWGSLMLFCAGVVLILLSIKGYYSVTKRSVKLLIIYYMIMQIIFISVGIVTLVAYMNLPETKQKARAATVQLPQGPHRSPCLKLACMGVAPHATGS